MAFQLVFNGTLLTINGPDGVAVQYNEDGTVKHSWPSLFEAMRDLPALEKGYDAFVWRGK